MSEDIIAAAARALQDDERTFPHIARVVIAAVTPMIRDAALEEAATRLLELAREERNLDAATLERAAERVRALKEQP